MSGLRNNDFGLTAISGQGAVVNTTYKGSFYDTTCQTITANTSNAMSLNSCDGTAISGFSITNNALGKPTRITAAHTGVYNLAFSGQLYKTGGQSETVAIWINVNGTPVSNTSTFVTLANNSNYLVVAWNFFVPLISGQYVELMWTSTGNNTILRTDPANLTIPYPAIPSVIATINLV